MHIHACIWPRLSYYFVATDHALLATFEKSRGRPAFVPVLPSAGLLQRLTVTTRYRGSRCTRRRCRVCGHVQRASGRCLRTIRQRHLQRGQRSISILHAAIDRAAAVATVSRRNYILKCPEPLQACSLWETPVLLS